MYRKDTLRFLLATLAYLLRLLRKLAPSGLKHALAFVAGTYLPTEPHYRLLRAHHYTCFLSSTFPEKKRQNSLFLARDFPCFRQDILCILTHEGMFHPVAFFLKDQ